MNFLHGFKSLRPIGMQVGDSGTPRWDRVLPIPCAEAWPSCQVVESLRQLRSRRMTLLAASNPVSLASTLALSATPVKGECAAPLCLIVCIKRPDRFNSIKGGVLFICVLFHCHQIASVVAMWHYSRHVVPTSYEVCMRSPCVAACGAAGPRGLPSAALGDPRGHG